MIGPTDEFNKCIKNSFDETDARKCENKFINFMENDYIDFVKDLMRQY